MKHVVKKKASKSLCHQCDYTSLIKRSGLAPTLNRLKVFEVIGNNNFPLSAQEIFITLKRTNDINRVTVYRILNLLVEKGLVERIISGDRSHRYGMAPNTNHQPHAHFYCKTCNRLECLNPNSLKLDIQSLKRTFPGNIESTQIRIDGVCKNCMKQ